MVEGARLESVYTPKAYRGFESLPLRHLVCSSVGYRDQTGEFGAVLRQTWRQAVLQRARCGPKILLLRLSFSAGIETGTRAHLIPLIFLAAPDYRAGESATIGIKLLRKQESSCA